MSAAEPSFSGETLGFVEALYARYRQDPAAVAPSWREYFEGLDGEAGPVALGPSFRPASIFDPPAPARPSSAAASPGPPPAATPRPEVVAPEPGDAESWVPFLKGLRLFSGAASEDVAAVAKDAREVRLEDGQHLFRQGEAGHDLFVILEGSIVVWRDGGVVAELGPGQVVGELGVLDSAPRIADAIARGTLRALRIRGVDLLARMDERPALAHGLIRGLTQRIRERATGQEKVDQLIRAYRVRGHLLADLNPLAQPDVRVPELEPEHYGLTAADLGRLFASTTIPGTTYLTLRAIIERLREVYCASIGVQYMHIDSAEPKLWIQNRVEDPAYRKSLSRDEQLHILTKLTDAEIFEQFIHKKFLGAKRFSLEGAETLIPLLHQVIDTAAAQGVKEAVIGMPHRGRLNVLANVLGKSPRQIFREFADADAGKNLGRGDVKYHLGYSADHESASGETIHLSLCFNPSHLEFVGPVALGRVRAKQARFGDLDRTRGMAIILHGDAAFAGQGVVQEMLNMSNLPGYTVGGALHVIVNNQIGFTTPPESGRSTHYASDVAKMLQAPIFHVNGEHPEAVAHVIHLAMAYRREFSSDVILDMYCYRRYGHNEGDEPAFTQPRLYGQIRQRKTVREGYLDSLLRLGEVGRGEADSIAEERRAHLEEELGASRDPGYEPKGIESGGGAWTSYRGGPDAAVEEVPTGCPEEKLAELLRAQTRVPEGFTVHPKIEKNLFGAREAMAGGEQPLDWAAGEALAFASLVAAGTPVRLTGQDSGRGTFSHRHAVLHDLETGATFTPLAHLAEDQAPFTVWDSPLSEIGPTGFEFGYSLDRPESLVLWEAQFGDFSNVAQVIIDQFLSSTEDKWHRLSGLVLLLPHGFEGQGPEHSSARLERFLALCADDNMQVVNLTTPAQLFHCLRRQVLRPLRKPLVVMSPKSLLRHPKAVSELGDLAEGGFRRWILDPQVEAGKARKVLVCCGKVYYDLLAARQQRGADDVALVRLEQLYPLDAGAFAAALAAYPKKAPRVWVQEEPRNMGAWGFLSLFLDEVAPGRLGLTAVTRAASASPATGSAAAHKLEQEELMEKAFGASPDGE